MNRILALIIFCIGVSAHADVLKLQDYVCTTQLKTILNQWKIDEKADWKKQPADVTAHSFKTHGDGVGDWVTVSTPSSTQTLVSHFLVDGSSTSVTLSTNDCEKQDWLSTTAPKNNSKLEFFTDVELKKILEENKNGIIYVWSPNMSLSKKGIANIQAAAKDLGLPLNIYMDAFADQTFAKSVAKTLGLEDASLKRMKSRELASYGATLHYPATVVYKNGKVCHGVQNGYRDHVKYRQIITEVFGRCE